jgi:hypothetical protein
VGDLSELQTIFLDHNPLVGLPSELKNIRNLVIVSICKDRQASFGYSRVEWSTKEEELDFIFRNLQTRKHCP